MPFPEHAIRWEPRRLLAMSVYPPAPRPNMPDQSAKNFTEMFLCQLDTLVLTQSSGLSLNRAGSTGDLPCPSWQQPPSATIRQTKAWNTLERRPNNALSDEWTKTHGGCPLIERPVSFLPPVAVTFWFHAAIFRPAAACIQSSNQCSASTLSVALPK